MKNRNIKKSVKSVEKNYDLYFKVESKSIYINYYSYNKGYSAA